MGGAGASQLISLVRGRQLLAICNDGQGTQSGEGKK